MTTFPTLNVYAAFGSTWEDSPSWVDITSFVMSGDIRRGRTDELQDFPAGTARLRLRNEDRLFDPEHTLSALYPYVTLRVPVKIEATYASTTYPLFLGFATAWEQVYDQSDRAAYCDLELVDLFGLMANMRVRRPVASQMILGTGTLGPTGEANRLGPGRPSLPAKRPSLRHAEDVLEICEFPTAWYNVTAGGCSLLVGQEQGTIDQSLLEYVQLCVRSELGHFYVNGSGVAQLEGRLWWWNATRQKTSRATFTDDDTSAYRYADISYVFDDAFLTNECTRANRNGVQARSVSGASRAQYGPAEGRGSATGLLTVGEDDLASQAKWVVRRYKDPYTRVTGVKIVPARNADQLFPAVLDLELRDRVTIARTPQGISNTISADYHVEQISHRFDASRTWVTEIAVSDVDPTEYFVLGDSTLGPTGTDVLGP